ncbi:hypothetical protein ACJMK2_012558 [Sinanodonta woodiana]|uniref:Hexosyltransferase n=1 Tax=Sinanodonta woodiana TaxID=1069815 RepID=A0ABD3VAW3_SINWO
MLPRRIIRKNGLVFLASLCLIFLTVTFIVEWRDDVIFFWIPLVDGNMVFYTNFKCMTLMSKYLLNNPNLCHKNESVFFFLVIVHSAVFHFDQREFLIQTWVNNDLLLSHKMRVLFLVGLPRESSIQERLQIENDQHGDNCPGTFYRRLSQPYSQRLNNAVERNGRHAIYKYYFSGVRRLPFPFSAGPFLLIPNELVVKQYAASLRTSFLWLDDVYLFGILPLVTGNLSLFHLPKCYEDPHNAVECFSSKAISNVIFWLHSSAMAKQCFVELQSKAI